VYFLVLVKAKTSGEGSFLVKAAKSGKGIRGTINIGNY